MRILRASLPVIFLLVIMLITGRYLCFISFMNSQKDSFRTELLNQHQKIKLLTIHANSIYKDKAGIEWKKDRHELVINGQYYEVIGSIPKKDSVVVLLIHDKKENNLFGLFFSKEKNNPLDLNEVLKLLSDFNFTIPERAGLAELLFCGRMVFPACNKDVGGPILTGPVKPPAVLAS